MKAKEKILIKDLRENLKELVQKEIKDLPKHLESLEPIERINVLTRLMPYVFPKVQTVHLTQGEPNRFEY
jgi:hypothetical protein